MSYLSITMMEEEPIIHTNDWELLLTPLRNKRSWDTLMNTDNPIVSFYGFNIYRHEKWVTIKTKDSIHLLERMNVDEVFKTYYDKYVL
jgi:hypothetical protein